MKLRKGQWVLHVDQIGLGRRPTRGKIQSLGPRLSYITIGASTRLKYVFTEDLFPVSKNITLSQIKAFAWIIRGDLAE